jgi:hypothetical protein
MYSFASMTALHKSSCTFSLSTSAGLVVVGVVGIGNSLRVNNFFTSDKFSLALYIA